MKALRIFYKNDGSIVGNCGLEGPGSFPYPIDQELTKYNADKCLEIVDQDTIRNFLISGGGYIEEDTLVLGERIEPLELVPARNLPVEVDDLTTRVVNLEEEVW